MKKYIEKVGVGFIVALVCYCHVGCRTLKHSKKISNGVSSEIVTTANGQRAHVATIDLRLVQLRITHANKRGELAETSTLANQHGAIVAVNGGFFGADGSFVGPVKIDGRWLSKPHPSKLRGAIGFDDKHGVFFDRLTRREGAILHSDDNFATPQWWDSVENILGGTPLLVVDGKKIDPAPEETVSTFLTERYARTAICSTDPTTMKLVVIDGGDRNANLLREAKGMSVDELADFMLKLGCTHALNLDGGYSSTFVAFGKMRNQFSLTNLPERPVSTVLLVLPRVF